VSYVSKGYIALKLFYMEELVDVSWQNTFKTFFDIHIYINGYFTVHLNKFSSVYQIT